MTTKANRIRDYHRRHPEATRRQIQEGLMAEGVEVKALSQITSALGVKAGKLTISDLDSAQHFLMQTGLDAEEAAEILELASSFVDKIGFTRGIAAVKKIMELKPRG